MTSSIKILTLLLLLAATVSAQSPLEDCVRTFNAQTDCFKTKSTTSGAKLFTVEYKNYYKVITVNAPFKPPTNYTLYIRGAPRDGLPTNVNGTFEIPVRSVATFDTTTVPYIELLGRRSTIKAASSPEYVSSPCFQKLLADGQIAKVDEKNTTSAEAALRSIDAIFSGLGSTGTLAQGKWVTQSASSDPGTFNRAEWLEYFAQWYGLEGEAETMTNQIKARYDAAKEAAAKAKPTNPTKLAWVMYSAPASWNDNVASWSFSLSPFKKQVVEDASATFTAPATASYKDAAEFRKQLADVDVVVWESFTSGDMATFKKEFGVDDTFKFVKNNQVYALDKRTNPSAFLDWFESALVFPNVILQDIVAITNPAVKNVQRTYLRKVDSEKPTVLTKDQCSGDANAAMPVMGLNDAEIKSTIVAAPGNSASAAQGKLAAVVAAGVAAVAMIVA